MKLMLKTAMCIAVAGLFSGLTLGCEAHETVVRHPVEHPVVERTYVERPVVRERTDVVVP